MASDYAQLARRISGTTSKCLLTAIVLVAGLGFGRQVLHWWREDETPSEAEDLSARLADGLGDPERLHTLQFGDLPWSLLRQSLDGSKDQAAAALRASCREVLQQNATGRPTAGRSEAQGADGRPPQGTTEGTKSLEDPGEGRSEGEFLRRLVATEPAEEEPGKWRLYELNETFPMVVGTAGATDAPAESHAAGAVHLATWGMAVPDGPQGWTLWTFQQEDVSTEGFRVTKDGITPPFCTRTLSIKVANGGAVVGYRGNCEPEDIVAFYDDHFARHNWEAAVPWQQSAGGYHARFVAAAVGPADAADVHIGLDGTGGLSGLLMITPAAIEPTEKGNR